LYGHAGPFGDAFEPTLGERMPAGQLANLLSSGK
jgi:hypothetical protein